MAKAVIALGLFALLVIIIGIVLAVYFTTKKSKDTDEPPADLGPQIKVDSLSAKYNPASEEVVEDAIDRGEQDTDVVPASTQASEGSTYDKYKNAFSVDQFDISY